MVKSTRRPKASAQTVVVERDGKRYFSDDPEDVETTLNSTNVGSGRSFKSPQDLIRELLSDHFGEGIHITGFRFDLETSDGEVCVEWWSKVSRSSTK